ncbi:MAG: PolC-type DNA polymerase III [Eubacteriales bacterium]|nr:PolC-type DNA polymerase III [Eubacteriales bacterium]
MEMWRELLRPLDSGLARVVSLDRVLVSRDGKRMRILLNSERILNEQEEKALSEAMEKGFPKVQTETRVRYPALAEDFQADVQKYSSLILGRAARSFPGALPYLQQGRAEMTLRDGALQLRIAGKTGAEYIRKRGVDKGIEEIVRELFSLGCTVLVQEKGGEEARLRAIDQQREEEKAFIAALAQAAANAEAEGAARKKKENAAILGRPITDPPVEMSELTEDTGNVCVTGEVISFDIKDSKNGKTKIVLFSMTDFTNSIYCKCFLQARRQEGESGDVETRAKELAEAVGPGTWITVRGEYAFDDFQHDMVLRVNDIMPAKKPVREDKSEQKRVELHMHTQMSTMDAVASASDLIKQCAKWGHKAVAVTDHGVVQAFPEAFGAAKKNGIKLIPGCEGYLIDDSAQIVRNPDFRPLRGAALVVLDVETTGLSTTGDEITELGAVRFENGVEVAEFNTLVNPGKAIPAKVVELTGITDNMVRGMPRIEEIIPEFAKFCEGAVLCAHNAPFDMAFVGRAFKKAGLPFDHPQLDTLPLFRNVYPTLKSHKLGSVCKHLKVVLNGAHRASNDARATGQCLLKAFADPACANAETLAQLNELFLGDAGGTSYHIVLLAASQQGLTNLNRLVSESHVHFFHRGPKMPRGLIQKYREGLLLGSACEAGELYRAVLRGAEEKELKRIASFYDYLEIQPIGNNEFLLREGTVKSEKELQAINRRIVELGKRLGKPVVAAGDVHFKDPGDAIYRAIAMNAKGFDDCDEQPPLYLRTTEEMLEEFAYLGEEEARRVVIEAPNRIADMVGKISLFPPHPEGKETFQPFWEDAENDIRTRTHEKATRIYGDPIPEIVQKRIDKELGAIIGYGFSTLYDIAVKLVEESNRNGYLVGSRGSVGSSLVAFLTDITEVNALPAHYVCPNCKRVEFDVPEQYTCGLDLPAKDCPDCGARMNKDGYNIPFEVFLGFKGDKVPDIDLNFSGEYQGTGQHYIETLFGKGKVFRAGTIGTVAEKTAFGYVLKYLEERGKTASQVEKERLAKGLTGVKRTTGQHPGGMVLCPEGYEIYDFVAIQHPADDLNSEFITTHYDFNSMHDVLVKVDMLGHDDPTMLKDLQDLTGIPPREVPLNDPEIFKQVMGLFAGPECMGVNREDTGISTGTLGIPEFGTSFVRQMLVDTKPTTMEELIRISGLSHGTDVWLGNAADLVKNEIVPLNKCLCTRDDIMNQLIQYGVDSKVAFDTMEFVRKGKAAKGDGLKPNMLEAMQANNVPQWFIDSCNKIQYMFPKAHAVAYVTYALRIAFFKLFYPAEYYTCWLKRNKEDFSGTDMVASQEAIRDKLREIAEMERDEREKKEGRKNMLDMLLEMSLRGVQVLPVDIYESDPEKFILLEGKRILPPLSSLDNLGLTAAQAYAKAREAGRFISREDMLRRKVQPSVIDAFAKAGVLGELPESSQLSFFSM